MKLTRLKFLCLGLSAVLLFGLAACDDFVDVDPPNSIDSENFFNTEQDYQQALIGAYDLLQTTHVNVMFAEIASDNSLAGGESANDVPGYQEVDDMTHFPVNDQLRNIWNWMYAGVNRCNYIFEFRDKTDFEGKDQVLGQAAYLRAYYYFELVKFFGDVPMPIDRRVNFGESGSFDRTPVAEVYAQIEADLMFASSVLPMTQADPGRVTKGAAQALLGKAYLYQGAFSQAATVLDSVINSGIYDLVDIGDYESMFLLSGENGVESVFEVQYSDEEGTGFGCFQCSEGNIMVGFSGVRAYSGPVYADGFSFNIATQELVDAFEPGDGRLSTAVLDINAFAAANGASFQEGFEHTGFFMQKYIPRLGEQTLGDTKLTSNKNYRAIRFADVLLMAAEAYSRGGLGDATAQTYLNRVRNRAGLANSTATGAALTDAIYAERRVELAGEGHRFFDLVRTGRAAAEMNTTVDPSTGEGQGSFEVGKHEVFPIPLIEIQLAGGVWPQNAGYN